MRSRVRHAMQFAAGCTAGLALLGAAPAAAAPASGHGNPVIVVDDTRDLPDLSAGDGACRTLLETCTLRAATMEANARVGADVIQLPAGRFDIGLSVVGLDTMVGDFDLTDHVTIDGAGMGYTIVDGMARDRVFDVRQGVRSTFRDLTIQNGAADEGAGVRAAYESTTEFERVEVRGNRDGWQGIITIDDGTARVVDSRLTGNGSDGGAAIDVSGKLVVERTLIHDNEGKGVHLWDGTVSVVGSTISANDWGGIVAYGGTVTVTDSSITGNDYEGISSDGVLVVDRSVVADNEHAGIRVGSFRQADSPRATIRNSTIAGSGRSGVELHRVDEGEVLLQNATVTGNGAYGVETTGWPWEDPASIRPELVNTIVAGNAQGDCNAELTSLGHNIAGDTTCTLSGPGDRTGTDPLADNGGPTLTMALRDGSPAVDAADPARCPAVDQRGVARTGACDIGAYER